MIIPSKRLYLYAVKKAWLPVLLRTLYYWACAFLLCYLFCDVLLWNHFGWWTPLIFVGTYLLYLDLKVAGMIIRHEDKKKTKRFKLSKSI